jgi:hypothetical protein
VLCLLRLRVSKTMAIAWKGVGVAVLWVRVCRVLGWCQSRLNNQVITKEK